MDVSYINPFIEAVDTVFTTMLHVQPRRNGLKVSDGKAKGELITSLIGLSGQVSGVVALRFPPPTALALASRMLGSDMNAVSDEVTDAVAEMVNMVAGSAKARFNHDPPLELGLPTVVEGAGYRLKYPSRSVWLEVPFSSDAGDFTMEVTYNPN
ncbi:MAG: chemotaxis protein CheX [Phycisphaerales bacterium]|nr:chemotaxis protein CheX [Phycisphaerales bacterium]